MLKAALCGGYVNFGVFSLYGDDALEKALKTFVELLSSIPHSNLLVRRLLISVFGLWIDHRSIWYMVYHLHGKTKNSGGKNQMAHAIQLGKRQKKWAAIWGDAIFLLFLFCSVDLDILCGGFFYHHLKFNSWMFMHKISTRVGYVNVPLVSETGERRAKIHADGALYMCPHTRSKSKIPSLYIKAVLEKIP